MREVSQKLFPTFSISSENKRKGVDYMTQHWLKKENPLVLQEKYKLYYKLLRKISPELASAANPLFAKEDWSWANTRAPSSSTLYVGRLPQHSLLSSAMSTPRIRTSEPWAVEAECVNLTAAPPGWPPNYS